MSGARARRASAPAAAAPPLAEAAGALLLPAGLLAAIGAVMVYSATAPLAMGELLPPHFLRHAGAVAAGAALALAAARLPLRVWYVAAFPAWGLAVAALVATALFGEVAGGARRWLFLPGTGITVQPAEAAKLATLLAAAALLSRRPDRPGVPARRTALAFGLALVPAALCLLQPDLGSALLLGALVALLAFAAGARLRALVLPALAGAAGLALYTLLHPYALRRWTAFLDPWANAESQGFQLVQSFVAFGRGGLLGVGLGDGRQKLFYLPEAHTDFILALVAEETGLVGVGLVLGAFVALGVAGVRVALAARERFARLLAFAMTSLLTVPAAVNAAVVMGCLPTKGLTLPLVSYGRSSLLVCCTALGILLGVARHAQRAAPGAGRRAGGRP